MKPFQRKSAVLQRPSSGRIQTQTTMKCNLSQYDLHRLFQQLIEECAEYIIPFLDKQSIRSFRFCSRVTFYHVQSYQIWEIMLGDVQEQPKSLKQSQVSTQGSEQFSNTLTDMKGSYLKNTFYNKFSSRPTTDHKNKRIQSSDELWLKKPTNYADMLKSSKTSLLIRKNLIENNQLFISDDELRGIIDIWILNLRQLSSQIKLESFQTDSLVQEVTIWSEVVKNINNFIQESKEEHVVQILAVLRQRSVLDMQLERKENAFMVLKHQIVDNIKSKQNFAQVFEKKAKPILSLMSQAQLLQYFDQKDALLDLIDMMLKSQSIVQQFMVRSEQFFIKLLMHTIRKMKDGNFGIHWTVEFPNIQRNVAIMEDFIELISVLQRRHEYSGQFVKNQDQLRHQQNQKQFVQSIKVVSDILKMTKLNFKLRQQHGNQEIKFFDSYQTENMPFDLFEVTSTALWRETYVHSFVNGLEQLETQIPTNKKLIDFINPSSLTRSGGGLRWIPRTLSNNCELEHLMKLVS